MRDAVIVSTARTGMGKAYKGAFNATPGATLGAHSLKPAMERAGVDPGEVDDVLWGAALQQGAQAGNLARQVALRAGCPIGVSGMTIDRQCSSGLMSIATAAKQVITDRMNIVAAGGQESISLVQTPEMRVMPDPELMGMHGAIYMPMLQTAETVAKRYDIGRDAQDEYALQSQQRTAAAQENGVFDDEIVSISTTHKVKDKESGEVSDADVTIAKDEGNRPSTTLEGLQSLQPVLGPDTTITAGNAIAAIRRFGGGRRDGSQGSGEARPQSAGPLHRHGGRGHGAGRNGHRPHLRHSQAARTVRHERWTTSICGN